MSTTLRLFCALALAGLAGCQTLSRNECATGDWYSIGERDGANGHTEDRYLENAKACAAHGLPADRERWLEGRERGLERYCTARNAFSVGSDAASYQGVCRGAAQDDFLHGYELGRHLADARSRRSHWDSEIHRIHHELDDDAKASRDDKPDTKDGDKSAPHARLSDAERVELGFKLGVAVTRQADAERDCRELELLGQRL